MAATLKEVAEVITDLVPLPDDVTESFDLKSLNMDSLDWAEVIMALEEEFDANIEMEDVARFKTLGDIIVCLNKS